jgi:hypothetical protein
MTHETNKVYLDDDGIIIIHVVGDQNDESVHEMGDEAERLARIQRQNGSRVMVLDNLMQIGNVPPSGRRIVVKFGKKTDYDRLAFLGNGALLRLGANLLIQAVGKGSSLHYFEDEQKARHWLKGSETH